MSYAISFENVGKQYRLGRVGTGTLQHDLNRWFQTTILRKEDPYLMVGEVNDRSTKGHSDYVWALKDISFQVEQGDVVGIIGKNGAGKSTLLKLLSHITAPTMGDITYRGRIASLLEVGTGFHPEMTGRENIYMNGSIMGMTKAEITRKLDEIVDFAGVERYLDTPVKRYSSGMTVRLGFAVAAFLEPEILVVDEVLTVGDAEFQKKAIGKMQDVSQHGGRTVLFVSHNMDSMLNLCNNGILLENGLVKYRGDIRSTVAAYLGGDNNEHHFRQETSKHEAFISEVFIEGTEEQQKGMISFDESLQMHVVYRRRENCEVDPKTVSSITINTLRNTMVSMIEIPLGELSRKDEIHARIKFPTSILMPNKYIVRVSMHVPNVRWYDVQQETISFTICDNGTEFLKYEHIDKGVVLLRPQIELS